MKFLITDVYTHHQAGYLLRPQICGFRFWMRFSWPCVKKNFIYKRTTFVMFVAYAVKTQLLFFEMYIILYDYLLQLLKFS